MGPRLSQTAFSVDSSPHFTLLFIFQYRQYIPFPSLTLSPPDFLSPPPDPPPHRIPIPIPPLPHHYHPKNWVIGFLFGMDTGLTGRGVYELAYWLTLISWLIVNRFNHWQSFFFSWWWRQSCTCHPLWAGRLICCESPCGSRVHFVIWRAVSRWGK